MPGIRALRKIQMGYESSAAGTEANATFVWRGTGTPFDDSPVVHPAEDVGYLSGLDRGYIPRVLGTLEMEATPATFEQLPYILEAGVESESPSADGSGSSGYVYTYNFPTTAANTTKTYTVEAGDNQQEEQMLYSFVRSFALAGVPEQALMVNALWNGRQLATGTYTGALVPPTVEEILFQKAKIYIDAASGNVGSTQKTNTFLGFSLQVDTGLRPVWTGDGNLYFSFTKNIGPVLRLNVTFEHDSTSVAEKAAWRAGTTRLVRVDITGAALGTVGTGTLFSGVKGLRIDLAGKWESFDKIGERDGNDIVAGTLLCRYNAAESLFAQIKVANELSALT